MRALLDIGLFSSIYLIIIGGFYLLMSTPIVIKERLDYYVGMDRKSSVEDKATRGNLLKTMNETIKNKLSAVSNDKVENKLKSSGTSLNAGEYSMLKVISALIVSGNCYILTESLIVALLASIVGYIIPVVWIREKTRSRIIKFNSQLPDMINTIIGSLRTGYSFNQALKTVVEECEHPVRDEIAYLLDELSYGISMEEALTNLLERMPSDDMELIVQAVLIQRGVGGNLAEVMEVLLNTIRERGDIQRQVVTLTAQGRLSGRIVGGLPIGLGTFIYLTNPDFIKPLFSSTLGLIMVAYGTISITIGFILINKLTKIEV